MPINRRLGPGWLLVVAIALAVAVRIYVAANYGLTDDEAYYRLWALAPALSYLDHPPMTGWLIALGRAIAGDTALGVRLMQLIAFVAGTAALWRGTHLLFGGSVARTAVWITLAMPLLGVGGIIITPDGPSVLSTVLVYWTLAELVRSEDGRWWLAVGAVAGLGLLSKYTNLFLGAGIVAFLLLVPSQRRWFRSGWLWAGGVIAMLMAMPVLIWNAQHGWASFAKQFGRVTDGDAIGVKYVAELLGGFMALASPGIAVLVAIGVCVLTRNAGRRVAAALTIALLSPPILYFAAHAMHDRVQANWLAPLYPLLAVAAAFALHTTLPAKRRSLVGVSAVAVGLIMTGLLYAHALHPLDNGTLRKDPTRQGHGWFVLAQEVERLRVSSGADWIATTSYATTGQLAFALRETTPVIQLDERLRYVHLPAPSPPLLQQPALYVELARRADTALLRQRFEHVHRLSELTRWVGGHPADSYVVYLVRAPFAEVLSRP